MRSVSLRLAALGLAIVGVLLATAIALGTSGRDDGLAQSHDAERTRRFEQLHQLRHELSALRAAQGDLGAAIMAGDATWESRALATVDAAQRRLVAEAETLAATDPQLAQDLRAGLLRLRARRVEAFAALRGGDADLAPALAAVRVEGTALLDILDAAERREHAAMVASHAGAHAQVAAALGWIWLGTLAAAVLGVLLALTVKRSVVEPLRLLAAALRRLAAGEPMPELPPARDDEFGEITAALREFHEHAQKARGLAYRDPLTHLANRARLEEALEEASVRSGRQGGSFALMFLDLDNFKAVNESLGHSAGDRFLREAARRLERLAPDGALVARYSGDKFAVLLGDLRRDGTQAARLRREAEQILRGMAEPYPGSAGVLYLTVSIGIAIYPVDGQTFEQIVSGAEAAMYLAKRSGRNHLQFASPELTEDARRSLQLAGDIRRGLQASEFVPFYQPIVDARTGEVAGAEALLRWRHPQQGLVLPSGFIRASEDAGLIGDLGERCLTRAYEQALAWVRQGRPIPVSVNLSARQLHDERLLDLVQELQRAQQLPPHCLEFEITESAVMERPDRSQQTLQEIRRRGHRLSIDDFGTGHSALGYLQRFPIDRIKIDRSFVERVATSRQSRAIVSATLALAENLGLDVVAEGVETAEQQRHMRELGCPLQQGHLYSPALPPEEFEAWVAARA